MLVVSTSWVVVEMSCQSSLVLMSAWLILSALQINMKNFTENTFWAKTKEDKLEKPGLFDELTKTFAAKSAPKKKETGEGPEKKAAAKKKGKDLKVIDPKSAQNLCKYHKCLKLLALVGP